jgi:hypothetical protein
MNVTRKFRGIVAIEPRNPGRVTAGSKTLCVCAAIGVFLAFVSVAPAAEQIDQSNVPEWGGGWTHVNPAGDGQASMWQTFTPTCSNLTAVEIDILTTNPGGGGDVLTVEIARDGAVLASAERSVEDGFDGLLRFEFPQAVPVVPEQIYELRVHDTGTTRFGWKYASNTYERGSRYVFAQERPGSDWFFRTHAAVEPAAAKYGGGSGTVEAPYLIYTAEQMNAIGANPNDWDKHFKLMADIDLAAYTGTAFNIIGHEKRGEPFTGVFDGNGHTISHFTCDAPLVGFYPVGVFGIVGVPAPAGTAGEIRHLGLIEPRVEARVLVDAGSLVGTLWNGAVTGCYVAGGSVSAGWSAGGLVGAILRGSLVNCRSTASVAGGAYVGGLVGRTEGGTVLVLDCCSTGSVAGSRSAGSRGGGLSRAVGGLVGVNSGEVARSYAGGEVTGCQNVGGLVGESNYGSVTECYSTGAVRGDQRVGGLLGAGSAFRCYSTGPVAGTSSVGGLIGEGKATACFWDIETSGQDSSAGGTGKATDEMKTERTFADAGWDFVGQTVNGTEDLWWILEGRDYPRLWWEPHEDISPQPMDTNRPVTISKTVVAAETDEVYPGERVVFRICFETGVALTEVFVLDTLPKKAVFYSAQYDGVSGYYDPIAHAFLWRFPQLAAGEQRQVDITVLLHDNIPAGTTITNMARITSDQTEPVSCTLAMAVGQETDN